MNEPPSSQQTYALLRNMDLHPESLAFAEALFEQYRSDPDAVPAAWADYFDALERGRGVRGQGVAAAPDDQDLKMERLQVQVLQYINSHRFLGHFAAHLDPLQRHPPLHVPELTRAYHNLQDVDPDQLFDPGSLHAPNPARFADIEAILKDTYCDCIGAEYMHLISTAEKRWLQQRLESVRGRFGFDARTRIAILERLTAAEGLEHFLHHRYVGQKRFSLEGAESLIPLLNALIQRGGARGLEEMVVGMAHRGRLNVLVNIFGKSLKELAGEFEGRPSRNRGTGDVKYHLGYSNDIMTPGGPVHIALAFNPSHLEIVSPVVVGSVRARQVRLGDRKGRLVLPVVVHGDAAFAGQGVVMETLNMSQTRGFSTKGTIHIVVNNQIGFTTSTLKDARSTHYATDVAKMVSAPILHVNGDNPEAVVFVTQLALDYRMRFAKDVVIDLVCYRRQGHNEADEPAATQPMMYGIIRRLPTTRARYAERLIAEGLLDSDAPERMQARCRDSLDAGASIVPGQMSNGGEGHLPTDWSRFANQPWDQSVLTGVPVENLCRLLERLDQLPENFSVHPRVRRILDGRLAMGRGEQPLDWGCAETLAYATMIEEGHRVRLSGQDSGRGTFFHRHAVLHDQNTGNSYVPLRQLDPNSPRFLVIDSLLSEEGVLAFEYGYATASPHVLVIWEAQFGDFANGAQVVIDQFISSGEQKWDRLCGLVMLLPHGYEGQGPEHSSARPERYLQLCAQENMQFCVPTTPAQIFHLLRRQMVRPYRKPLVVMTPKSLLRHKMAVSDLAELGPGTSFQLVLDDVDQPAPETVSRVILTSGRLYYDLVTEKQEGGHHSVAVVRVEQCYPFPDKVLTALLERYAQAETFIWAQDEPENQGYLAFMEPRLNALLAPRGFRLHAVARPAAAAPAVGYPEVHKAQHMELLRRSFGPVGPADIRRPTE